jgi:catechol 2,3-dioxygenase-like lactoylglutathione lyase family enzyme
VENLCTRELLPRRISELPNKTTRGIDHVGITVPDIDIATKFFEDAFGAKIISHFYRADQPPFGSSELDKDMNLAPGTRLIATRMMKLGVGPDIELFELEASDRRPAARPSDFGLQHFAVYTDDIVAATQRFEAAGGKMLSEPKPLLFPPVAGDGNLYCYGQAPWGTMIEFITYPSEAAYEDTTDLRLWHAGS